MNQNSLISKVTAPKKIERDGEKGICITWQDDHETDISIYDLRLRCPCAKCVNEWTGEPLLDQKSINEEIKPLKIFSVGRYAMGIHFDDGHQSGIFSYDFLRNLGEVK